MVDPLSLPPATVAALRSRHVAFLAERLTDERARGDFVRSFAASYDYLLERPLRELVIPAALVEALPGLLPADKVRGFLAPVGREIHRRALASMRSDDAKLGDYVPAAAREVIDALIARPDWIQEDLVR